MSKWNGKRFSVYESEEKAVLGLIKNLGEQTNYNTDEVEKVKESNNKKVSHQEMEETYKIDKQGNFTGAWFGISKPTKSNEGIQTTVDKINEEEIPSIKEQMEQKMNKDGIVTMANLGQDVKSALTGGSVAVVGKNTILTENIVDRQVTSEKTDFSSVEVLTPVWINGHYINASGTISNLSGYSYSEPIQLLKGQSIVIQAQGANKSVAMISKKCDINIVKVLSIDSEIREYKYIATDNCNVVISTRDTGFVKAIRCNDINSKISHIDEVNKKLKYPVNTSYIEGKYINASGGIATLNRYRYSEPIKLSYLETIEFETNSVSNVSVLNTCNSDGTNIKSLNLGTGVMTKFTYTNNSFNDVYIIVCGDFRNDFIITKTINIDNIVKELIYLKNYTNNFSTIDYTLFFKNVVCIGDSLTRGYQSEYPEGQRNRDFNYPTALSRLNNWNVKNYGISGSTPTTWFNEKRDTNFSGYDCAIICLGRNGGLTSDEDKLNYKNIIDKLRTDNPHITIFTCSVPPSDYSNDEMLNNTIKSISSEKTTNFLDIYNNNILQDSKYRNDSCHFHALGYLLLANIINEKIKEYIAKNESQFMQFWSDNTLPDIIS